MNGPNFGERNTVQSNADKEIITSTPEEILASQEEVRRLASKIADRVRARSVQEPQKAQVSDGTHTPSPVSGVSKRHSTLRVPSHPPVRSFHEPKDPPVITPDGNGGWITVEDEQGTP